MTNDEIRMTKTRCEVQFRHSCFVHSVIRAIGHSSFPHSSPATLKRLPSMPVEVKVPEVGESITEVFVGEWHKAEGDEVKQDEDLVELESEKATFDAPAPASGVLKQILKKSGQTAAVGEVIAYIDDAKGGSQTASAQKKD